LTLVTAGRVGKPHGLDGSFYVEGAAHELARGTSVVAAGESRTVERRAGSDRRPLVRLSGVDDPAALRGEVLLVEQELAAGEWLAADLEGCEIPGLGRVRRVLDGPTCSVLELDEGTLVPFLSDAIELVDPGARRIEVRTEFLG
jgi:16S rRNA processing protein RimM